MRNIANHQHFFEQNPHLLKDLAYTLGVRREHLAHRAFCVTDGTAPLNISPATKSKSAGQIVLVFTGQGAQWAGMAKQLWESFDGFRRDIRGMDQVLAGLPYPPSWKIEGKMEDITLLLASTKSHLFSSYRGTPQKRCRQPHQPSGVLAAAVYSSPDRYRELVQLMGNCAGSCSGPLQWRDRCCVRNKCHQCKIRHHRCLLSMTSEQTTDPSWWNACCRHGQRGSYPIGMGRGEVTPYLIEGVVVACENSPENVTLSGDKKQINQVAMAIAEKQPEILVRHLKVGTAYHSRKSFPSRSAPRSICITPAHKSTDHMEEVVGKYYDLISDQVPTFRLDVPCYSSVTGNGLDDPKRLGPAYWRQNLESPALFHSAIRTVLEHLPQGSILVEVGPHSALAGPLRQIFKSLGAVRPPPAYLPTLVRGENGTPNLLTTLGQLYLLNVPLNFEMVTPGKEVLTILPTYAWHHDTRLWDESRVTREWRLRKFPSHELLGSRILEGNDLEPTWRNLLDIDGLPWLQHHKVFDDVVFPAAGYITMVGEAIRQLSGSDAFSLHHSLIKTALVLQDSSITEMMTCLRQKRLTTALHSEWYEFTISSFNGTAWIEHCIGQVGAGRVLFAEPQGIDALPRKVHTASWYSTMRKIGLNYGQAFQALTDISADSSCATAAGSFTDGHRSSGTSYQLHP